MSKIKNDREMNKKNNTSNANRFLQTYINAKNANSNFFDLIKICQNIKSINMRKNQIFSVFFDRVSVLQNRICNDCIIRFFETILCDFKSYLYNTFFRNDIDLIFCHTKLYNTFFRNRII